MKIVVKCDPIYFSGEKNRIKLGNRHGNLIWEHPNAYSVKEGGKIKEAQRDRKERL
jgi:hypothetical protein